MKSFEVTKKARKYFAATLEGKYNCKILIDENSQDLELGAHELDVDDISVRSKYGTDLIFKLKAPVAEQQQAGICSLRHERYNQYLVDAAHTLGGKWDPDTQAWIFSGLVADEVEELDEIFNSEPVGVELTAKDDIKSVCDNISFCGYTLAVAFGRDSGAKMADGVSFIVNSPSSGGSHKNWQTIISEGSVIRLYVPIKLLSTEYYDADMWDVEVL